MLVSIIRKAKLHLLVFEDPDTAKHKSRPGCIFLVSWHASPFMVASVAQALLYHKAQQGPSRIFLLLLREISQVQIVYFLNVAAGVPGSPSVDQINH